LGYRGLDTERASYFLWSGAELQKLDVAALTTAFKVNCCLQDWEADYIGEDVWVLLQVSLRSKYPWRVSCRRTDTIHRCPIYIDLAYHKTKGLLLAFSELSRCRYLHSSMLLPST
jgi:hypothetical protein